jgi:hypothetical protein
MTSSILPALSNRCISDGETRSRIEFPLIRSFIWPSFASLLGAGSTVRALFSDAIKDRESSSRQRWIF